MTKKWAHMTVGHGRSRDDRIKTLDGYNTPSIAVHRLRRAVKLSKRIWEPCNGNHRISRIFQKKGHTVFTSDIFRWDDLTKEGFAVLAVSSRGPYRSSWFNVPMYVLDSWDLDQSKSFLDFIRNQLSPISVEKAEAIRYFIRDYCG